MFMETCLFLCEFKVWKALILHAEQDDHRNTSVLKMCFLLNTVIFQLAILEGITNSFRSRMRPRIFDIVPTPTSGST